MAPPIGTLLWNDGFPSGLPAPVSVCFTVRPHQEWDGSIRCKNQLDDTACNGEPFVSDGGLPALRLRVRDLVENAWQRYGQIEFVDGSWGDCPATEITTSQPAIIQVTFESSCQVPEGGVCEGSDAAPWDEVRGPLGKSGIATDVHLDWKRIAAGLDDAGVVHEFGHALGFAHVVDADQDQSCPGSEQHDYDERSGVPVVTDVAGFQTRPRTPNSLMGPCPNIARRGARTLLSAWDTYGLQTRYGEKPSGSLVTDRGLCATILGHEVQQGSLYGSEMVPFYCRSGGGSTWLPEAIHDGVRFRCPNTLSSTCLGEAEQSDSSTATMDAETCSEQPDQSFSMEGVEWRAMGTECIAAASDGNELLLQDCDGSPSQKWDFFGAKGLAFGRIRQTGTDLCVTVPAIASRGAQPLLKACNAQDPRQVFDLPGDTTLRYGDLCMSVLAGEPKPGSLVELWDYCPSAFFNVQFYFSGSIHSFSAEDSGATSSCLSAGSPPEPYSISRPLRMLSSEACDRTRADQGWDYRL